MMNLFHNANNIYEIAVTEVVDQIVCYHRDQIILRVEYRSITTIYLDIAYYKEDIICNIEKRTLIECG